MGFPPKSVLPPNSPTIGELEAIAKSRPVDNLSESDLRQMISNRDYLIAEYAKHVATLQQRNSDLQLNHRPDGASIDRVQLADALSQAVSWIEECGSDYEGRQFVLTEARAALRGIRLVESTSSVSSKDAP